MKIENTTLDDLCSVIGFTPTCRLSAWFGGLGSLYIPEVVDEGQLLVKLVGLSAAKRLSQEWGGSHLWLPSLSSYETDRRARLVARLVQSGISTREIASLAKLSERRVQMLVKELTETGLVTPAKNSGELR